MAGSTIAGTVTQTVTLGSGTYSSPLTILSSGYVTLSGSGDAIYGPGTAAWDVINQGRLKVSGAGGVGVSLAAGGSVDNAGGLIEGAYRGVEIKGGVGTVINSGTIIAGYDAVFISGGAGTVVDTGAVLGTAGDGVDLHLGGYVSIAGTGSIVATGSSHFSGAYIGGTAGTIVNNGSVAVSGTIDLSGIVLGAGGSIANTGRVTATGGASVSGIGLLDGGVATNAVGALVEALGSSVVSGIYVRGAAGTVVNDGSVAATASAAVSGIVLLAGGSVTDSGAITGTGDGIFLIGGAGGYVSIAASGSIGVGHAGVYLSAGAVDNDGTIIGAAGGIDIKGTGSVVNAGTVLGGSGAEVSLYGGGSLYNSGLIQGLGGMDISGAAGTVVNSGKIEGTSTASFSGIEIDKGGIITNMGTGLIQGHAGVYVPLGAPDVTIVNSATIEGSGNFATGIFVKSGGSVDNAGGVVEGPYEGVAILDAAGTVVNTGRISGTIGDGVILDAGGTVTDSGSIAGGGGTAVYLGGTGSNLVVLDPGYSLTGAVAGGARAANTLELGGSVGSPLSVNYNGLSLTNFSDLLFGAGGNDTLAASNTTGTLHPTLSGFVQASETIDLTQLGAPAGYSVGNSQLTVTGANGTVTFNLDGSDATSFRVISDGAAGTDVVVCYAAGTRILTPAGEVAVEELRIGDRVMTLSGASQPIKWIGRRAYGGRFLKCNRRLLPIRIKAGALGDGVPRRDLLVSPPHALFIDGLLVPAEALVNGVSIVPDATIEEIAYYHIELAHHDVVLAEGAAAETFVDCDNRGQFHNRAEFAALYPGEDRQRWRFCAPRVEDGPYLERVWRRLARRAGVGRTAA